MIVTENIKIRDRNFVKTYSDADFYIERDGVRYAEALDLAELHRKYAETDIKIQNIKEKNDYSEEENE